MPHGCGLLLHAVVPSRDRRTCRGCVIAFGNLADCRFDALGYVADVPSGSKRKSARSRLCRDARAVTSFLVGQVVRACSARIRSDLVDHHHHPLVSGRYRALTGKSLRPRRVPRSGRARHCAVPAHPWRRLPRGFHRGSEDSDPPCGCFLGIKCCHSRRRSREHHDSPDYDHRLDGSLDRDWRRFRRDPRARSFSLSPFGSRSFWFRDRGEHDAVDRGNGHNSRGTIGISSPEHSKTSHCRRRDHECLSFAE